MKKRISKKQKEKPIVGASIEEWQSSPHLVRWARTSEEFRSALAVLIYERRQVVANDPTATENVRLGRIQGYETALATLESLGKTPESLGYITPEPTYDPPEEGEP